MSATSSLVIEFVPVERLRHIEGFSKRRVEWLTRKIVDEGLWTKPVALDEFSALAGLIRDFWFRCVQLPPKPAAIA